MSADLLVLALLAAALLAVVGSLAVHAVESLLDGRPSVAALGALGTTREVLVRAQRWEAGLVTLPVTVVGVLGGATLYYAALDGGGDVPNGGLWLALTLGMLVGTVALVCLAIVVSTWLTRPWLRRAASPLNLRTE
ncbi:hypothetical protein [Nocardioides sp. CER19]|uniref:hypothetical protein n=1 Tax=Nocardioides sp. CER19 TaxID=3038538 RepID=UPI00244D3399|nr:hypothetical protein [Nocardioides sp. CER19]MDH2413488.1 hypothetical protein [Nocardioides sp. CER19]